MVRERPPAGWAISEISAGGTSRNGTIEWSLTGDALEEGKVLGYTATAGDSRGPTVSWGGVVLETAPGSEERAI